jgi:hypothetical protein
MDYLAELGAGARKLLQSFGWFKKCTRIFLRKGHFTGSKEDSHARA